MAIRTFDRKFGKDFLKGLPACPGVYTIYNEAGRLIYIGKAKNLRRRLSQYRNAKRRKKHYKMRTIVGDAARIEFQTCETHLDACLLEARLIQEHRPRWNVAGAFYFMYPMVALRWEQGNFHFCFTTEPELFSKSFPGYEFHGAFRSREIAGEAFFALMRLLTYIGHPNPRNRRNTLPAYTYLFTFRRLPENWTKLWSEFFRGESKQALEELVLALIENAGARKKYRKIQEHLDALGRFWRHEVIPLAKVRRALRMEQYPIPQSERDLIFLRHRLRSEKAPPAVSL